MEVKIEKLIKNIEKAIKGKREVIELSLVPLLSGGHLLFMDIPGVGKSTLAEAIARSIDLKFSRIQFTSDLLPSDIIGVNIFNRNSNNFEFRNGPIFSNIVLADEINRASPKTQSALLEAMSERTVSVDNFTYKLPHIFMVIATENPIEFAGTYPLPESELDRFMLSLRMGYPPEDIEKDLMKAGVTHGAKTIESVLTHTDIDQLIEASNKIYAEESVVDYMMNIVQKTRESRFLSFGVSTRGSIEFLKAVKSYAFIKGRTFVIPEDVKIIAPFVLSHRVIAKDRNIKFKEDIIGEIIQNIKAPV